ncbi:MAG: T9SS type A sorting domain-containing protein [Flavobacteriales bacterium]|nr:T9SS type A sorting domain-containing protein [Flavobacteriales bacterium]
MRQILLTFIFVYSILLSGFSQSDNPATAPLILLGNWATGGTSYAGNLGATSSGMAVCSGTDVDDVWYRFTSTTQAVRIVGTTTAFNMVLELWTNGPGVSLTCQNINAGIGGETLRAINLTPGAQYYLRVHSTGVSGAGNFNLAVSFLPKANIRSTYTPNPLGDDAIPGYKIANNTSRNIFTAAQNLTIEATRYKLEDSATGILYYSTSTGSTGLKNLNDFDGLCYNKTYYAWVEIQVQGFWCGYSDMYVIVMEPYPSTTLQAGFSGGTYVLSEWIKCNYVGNEQLIEWELSTDNGTTVLNHSSGNSTYCYFNEVDCIRYNKIYQVRIRVNYCGVWGPWGIPYFIITAPLPYTFVWPIYCNQNIYPGGTILTQFLEIVDQYGWQFAPIETGDPLMVPIGPAIVTYTPTTTCSLLPIGLEPGLTYRVGTKPFVGTADNCNDPQEGDYGNFCPIHIIASVMGIQNNMTPMAEEDLVYKELVQENTGAIRIFQNQEGALVFQADARETEVKGKVSFEIYNSAGQLVKAHQFWGAEPGAVYQLPLESAGMGVYIVNVISDYGSFTQKVYIQ